MPHSPEPSFHSTREKTQRKNAPDVYDAPATERIKDQHAHQAPDVLKKRMQRVREAMDALDGLIERARELSHDGHPTRKESQR